MKRTSNPGHPNSKQPEIPKAQYVCNSSDEDECREAFHLNPKQKQTLQSHPSRYSSSSVYWFWCNSEHHWLCNIWGDQCRKNSALKTNQCETSSSWRRQPCPDSPCRIVFWNDQYSVRADGPDQVPGTQSTKCWLPPELWNLNPSTNVACCGLYNYWTFTCTP